MDGIAVQRDGALTRITFDRPDRLNSLTTDLLADLAARIRAADDGVTKVVVLTGAGRAFCSGADLSSTVDAATVAAANDVVLAIAQARAAVVAAVNGAAAGVGASIAIACDLTVATASAFLLMPFLPLGLVPDGAATHTLVARAGAARAARLAFGGERLPAAQAAEWGLFGEVVPDGELEAVVDRLVDRLLDAPAAAVFETKALLRRADRTGLERAGADEHAVQGRLLASDEYSRARAGFLGKRPVSFRAG
jgi:enoyl-CoA hydratase/carnithine racemase